MRLFASPLRGAIPTAANRLPGPSTGQPTSQLDGLLGLLKGNNARRRSDPGGVFDIIGNTTQPGLFGQGAGLLPASPPPGFDNAPSRVRDPHEAAVAALLGRPARNARREPRPPAINLAGFSERDLDALTDQIGAFKRRRFAGAQVSAAQDDGGTTRDFTGDGKNDMQVVCITTKEGNEICRPVPIHRETEAERDAREREEVEEAERLEREQRERRRNEEELRELERRRKEFRRNDNIRGTKQCQDDPDCRLA